MVKVAKYASENGKYFALNLSAPFIPEFFKDPMGEVLPYANVVSCKTLNTACKRYSRCTSYLKLLYLLSRALFSRPIK